MSQTALFDFGRRERLAWPYEEIVEVLHESEHGISEAALWRKIPVPDRLMIPGKRGKPPRRPSSPVGNFGLALSHLCLGDVLAWDGERYRVSPWVTA